MKPPRARPLARREAQGFLQTPEVKARLRREVSIRRIARLPSATLRLIPKCGDSGNSA